MSQHDDQDLDELDDRNDLPDEEDQEEGEAGVAPMDDTTATVGSWAVSITGHLVLALIFSFVVFLSNATKEQPATRMVRIDPPAEMPPKEQRDVVESKMEAMIESDVESNNPMVSNLDLEVAPVTETEDEVVAEVPIAKGREEACSDAEMGGTGAFAAIGAGGGGKGMMGSRKGGGKKRAIGKFGGSRGSESAVDAALRWFMRHQSPNGMWDVTGYGQNCDLPGPKCEPGSLQAGDANAACTGYALLCFLGAGNDHRTPNKYKNTVKKGLDWLVTNQKADGALGPRNYEHAVCTMALCEALAMTNDPALREPCEKAVKTLLARQTKAGAAAPADPKAPPVDSAYGGDGLGWDYISPNPGRNDSSVTGWNVMALKSAKAAGIEAATGGMAGAEKWLVGAWKAANKGLDPATLDPYKGESVFPYTWAPASNASSGTHLACVGLVASVFLGKQAGDPIMESLANTVMKTNMVTAYPTNTYFMYYNTMGIFQMGGERWNTWNKSVRDILVNAQRKGGDCFDGSWEWTGTGFHGHNTGRLLSTAYCCLSLEVYYRYVPIALKK